MELPQGLYDRLITDSLQRNLEALPATVQKTVANVPTEEIPGRIAESLGKQLALLLDEIGGGDDDRATRQLTLVNALLVYLRQQNAHLAGLLDPVVQPPQLLKAIQASSHTLTPPETGLSAPWLFTAGKGAPSLLSELRHELASCDQVDILVSFITVSGIRKLQDILQSATAVDAQGQTRLRIRVLTTTYIGATESKALDYLARLPGCEVKVSLDGRRTRLHAKAWIFRRQTGFGSAYVGSANLSAAALLGGLEWTVKFTEQGQEALYRRSQAHFETLWADAEFQRYNPDDPEHQRQLKEALQRESGQSLIATPTFFDLQPKDYQQDMLEQLALERENGRRRNLVVAATGVGKTVVAAFDYRAACQKQGGYPRLLFVAHRKEILWQALRTYQQVLRNSSFGEVLADGSEVSSCDHLFATIDSIDSREVMERFGTTYWHTVVVDECHRVAANRFKKFVTQIQPQILLGLTATPERGDGEPILPFFDNRPDGSPAVEMRLWHALERQLLCPFEYYGCDDMSDFSDVRWGRPEAERDDLDRILTGNDMRARLVISEWERLTNGARQSRAIAFCVNVAHAEFMTAHFNKAGLPAKCVVGGTDPEERRKAPEQLARGELSVLVTCDLYNEGVDLPAVDTLLLLRPTQSPVVFQQQIGRGLRLYPGKESCLIVDFVGRHRVDFRFDRLFSAITGLSRGELTHAVEHGFGTLPPGCHIQLQRQTREQVLRNLRSASQNSWKRLRAELQAYVALRGRSNIKLADFLRDQALELSEVYRDREPSGWTSLMREAGLVTREPGPEEPYLGRRFASLLHVDDPVQLELLSRVAESECRYDTLCDSERLRLQMVTYQLDSQHGQVSSGRDLLDRLHANPNSREELGELAGILAARTTIRSTPLPGLADVPLTLHAAYEIREILTAFGWLTAAKRTPFQAGVLALAKQQVELLFVTLDKSEGFHDQIAYRDYAISPERFHWQSQNSAGPETVAGRRYVESASNGWRFYLFVRARKGEAYRACGPVTLEEASGSKPMSIVWKLTVPLPTRLFTEFSVLRG